MHTLNEQNPLVFVQEYLDKIYIISGYVASINSEYFVLNIAPDGGANLDMNIRIYPADKDELLIIVKNDLVIIAGELITDEMIAKTGYSFYFSSAYIVTDELQVVEIDVDNEVAEDIEALTADNILALTVAQKWTSNVNSDSGVTYEFYEDGTGKQSITFSGNVSVYDFTWEILGNEVTMQTNIAGVAGSATLFITRSGDDTHLSNDKDAIFVPAN